MSGVVLALVLAQPANPFLEEAERLARALRFTEAIARLEVAEKVPGLSVEQRQAVATLLGRCQVAVGDRAAAVATFSRVLGEDPGFGLDRAQTPPKVLEAFDEARAAVFPPAYVRLEELPTPAGRAEVRLVDPWGRVAALRKRQARGDGEWTEERLVVDGKGHATFPLVLAPGERAAWYVEALSADGEVVARLHEEAQPRTVSAVPVAVVAPVAPARGLPARRVGGVVTASLGAAALGVGVGLLVSSVQLRRDARDRTSPPGDFADTARAAEAAGVAQGTAAVVLLVSGGVAAAAGGALILW